MGENPKNDGARGLMLSDEAPSTLWRSAKNSAKASAQHVRDARHSVNKVSTFSQGFLHLAVGCKGVGVVTN